MKLIDLDNLNRAIDSYNEKAKKTFAAKSHGTHLTLGTTSSTAFRGDYGNTAYKHSQSAHAPSNAQKNSDITKAEIEAKLTGTITSHAHNILTTKADNYKDNSALPSTYERGETIFFSNSPSSNKFNNLTYGLVQTLKEYGSGPAAWQFLYPYNTSNDTFYVRNAQYGTDSWRSWAEVYTSLNKPTPADIGAAAASHGTHLTIGTGASNAAAGNHTHSYLPLSGGTLTGKLKISLSSSNTGLEILNAESFFSNSTSWNDPCENETAAIKANGRIATTGDVTAWGTMKSPVFQMTNSPGEQNNIITGGNGDAASFDTHNMVIKSHWGIGFRDYQDKCRMVIDTRQGSISGQGDFYTWGKFLTESGITSNGTITANGETVCNGRAWMSDVTLSGMFLNEHKFSVDGAWTDPWEGIGCAIKAHGHIATNYTVKAGYLNTPQGEFNGWPNVSDSFIKIRTEHDGNGQGDGVTHLGYNNGDGYHHFFRGTGAMHINMHQGVQISNNFIYLAGIPLTISGNAPSIGGVWIQI